MKIEITAKSIDEAIDEALKKLDTTIDEIDYEVLQEPAKGFLGLGSKNAIIKVWIKKEEEQREKEETEKRAKEEAEKKAKEEAEAIQKEAEASKKVEISKSKKNTAVSEPEKVAEKTTVFEFDSKSKSFSEVKEKQVVDPTDRAVAFLKEVFEAMNIEVEITANFVDNKVLNVNLSGAEMGVVIGKRGQTLDSLQYLLNLVINKGDAAYVSVNMDTEHYREKRKETLERLAFNLAKKAKHLRKNVVLEPMNPFERRIIHYTLQNDRYVTTYSEGVEPYRYVVISPKSTYQHKTNTKNYGKAE